MDKSPLSLTQPQIKVKPGDNWFIVARKGAGKTTLAKLLTNQLMQMYDEMKLYVFDIKMRDFNYYPNIHKDDSIPPKLDGKERIQVWQPYHIIPENVEEWLFRLWHDPPAIIQIDEMAGLRYKKSLSSPEFTTITKLGRALPITTISETQELVELPRGAMSQPDHIIRMRLKYPYEINFMNRLMGYEMKNPRDKWGLFYQNAEEDSEPVYFPDAQTFLGLEGEY